MAIHAALDRGDYVGAAALIPSDADWPAALDDLAVHAPPCLWVRGDPGVLAADAVAVVGARAASGYGEHVASELSAGAANHGLIVVSGAAYGIDGAAHRVFAQTDGSDQPVQIGPTEYRLLHFFMTHAERVYSRAQLLDHVWGGSVYVEERTIDVHIRRLRKTLEPFGAENMVQTVRGAGYRFSASM